MKNKKIFVLLLMILSFGTLALAQDIAFTVISVKGYAHADNVKIKIGSKIKNSQAIKIEDGSYLCLATKDNIVLEITKAGTYIAKDLASKVPAKNGVSTEYVKFVVDELTKVETEGVSAKNRFQHMNKTGAVTRSLGNISSKEADKDAHSIGFLLESIEMEDEHYLYGNILALAWKVKQPQQGDTIANYEVELLGLDESSIFSQRVNATEVNIDLSMLDMENHEGIICQITPLDSEGNYWKGERIFYELPVRLLNKSQKEEISKKLSKSTTALEKLMDAKFFEDKKLFLDAAFAYKEAIHLSGGSPVYEELYYRFWVRNSMK